MKAGVSGAVLAMAAATMFLASTVHAEEAASSATSQQAQVKCLGANDCKGQSACKTATSTGPGENSCKGQGLIKTQSEDECKSKGGHVQS
jgi:hypothetical protein